jgi:multidrug efflux pump subunit AcrA (membrane-fusion protein)
VKSILTILALLVAGACVAACAGYIGYMAGRSAKPAEEAAAAESKTATVVVAPARKVVMGRNVVAYGVVRAAPEAVHVCSVPFESRVRRFLVTPGQPVAAGAVLVEIEPSPATVLLVDQAKSTVASATKKVTQAKQAAANALQDARNMNESAAKTLRDTQQRLALGLATSQEHLTAQQEAAAASLKFRGLEEQRTTPELLQAQQDLELAQLQLANLEKSGAGAAQVKAEVAGVVDTLAAQEGQIVPAGGALLQVAEEKRIEARLGVEPADATLLAAGMPVQVTAVHGSGAKPVEGHIRLVTSRVNPTSRLVEVFVTLPADANLLLESYVIGRAVIGAKEVLAVPRSAVLPDEDKHVLFTVEDERAARHVVETGLEQDGLVEIVHGEVSAGDDVVIEGNYELEDAMEVEVETPGAEKEKAAETPAAKESKPAAKKDGPEKKAAVQASETAR